jgi:hypothetical protein
VPQPAVRELREFGEYANEASRVGVRQRPQSRRPESAYGSGRSRTAFTTLKIAVVAPIPSARQATAEAVKPGFFAIARSA